MPERLKNIAAFIASPYGIILVLAWIIGSIWSAYRRLKNKGKRAR
jgi:fumarate reductase subunit D